MADLDDVTPMEEIGPESTGNKYTKDELKRFTSGGYKDMPQDEMIKEAATYYYLVTSSEADLAPKQATVTPYQNDKLKSIIGSTLKGGKNRAAASTVNDYFYLAQSLTLTSKNRDIYNNRALGNAWRLTYMLSNMKSIEFVGMLDAHNDAQELKDASQWSEEWASLSNTVMSDSGMLNDLSVGWAFVKQELQMNNSWFTLLQLVSEVVHTDSVDLMAHHMLEDDGVLGRLSREAGFVSYLLDAKFKDAPHYAKFAKILHEMKDITTMTVTQDRETVESTRKLIATNDTLQSLGGSLAGMITGLYSASTLGRK